MTSSSRITCTSEQLPCCRRWSLKVEGILVNVVREAALHLFEVCTGKRPSTAFPMLRQASHRRRATRGRHQAAADAVVRLAAFNGKISRPTRNLHLRTPWLAHGGPRRRA